MSNHHVVVVGGGFAGIQLVQKLRKVNVQITLIDRRNHHLFQPLLYQVATTILATSEIAWPIRRLFAASRNVKTLLGEVVSVDRSEKSVRLKTGHAVTYNTLVVATGARHAYFGQDDWESFAPGLKTLEDATTIRRRLLLAFEQAELESDEERQRALLTFCIIGAGPTGVELAGIIAELAHRTLQREFRTIDTRSAKIILIEAGTRPLATFAPELSQYTEAALNKLGVEVRTGDPVTQCDGNGVVVAGEIIPCRTIIWAAGVKASDAAIWLSADADRAGRVIVEPDLTVKGDADIFVVGDTALVLDADGKPVPGIAPAAKQQGAYVADVIRRRLHGRPKAPPFAYKHLGNLATIGPGAAVVDFGWVKLRGSAAWWVWGTAHIFFLIGVRNRFAVALSWLWVSLRRQHSARLITQKETLKDA
ncbi:NADH:ubiquinone reductase (H+-translocating) (plasmid) [Ensifer sp. WSM1721]|uniref:NAD(P)/FAD-dependent oxidoreductase n=1 Tax=Ensifer sp. WSM1721 TaxID=1041159 RepID=UPI00047CFA4C|nr:NAD(P)/FAD-dependent oxidoreductase [Ensifer sp. WSM1721]